MKLIEAICTDNPREVTTKYGQRLVIDAIDRATGEKITLWRPANDDYSRQYIIKNSPITVGIDSTGKYSLIENPEMETLGHAIQITKPINRRPIPESSKKPSDCEHFFLSPNEKKEIGFFGLSYATDRIIRNETLIEKDIWRFLSIVFDLERTNQLNLLPDKDLVDLCHPIEPYQVTKNQK